MKAHSCIVSLFALLFTLPVAASRGGGGTGQGPQAGQDLRQSLINGQLITYEVIDGMAIFEGDMVLGTPEEVEAMARVDTQAWGIASEGGCFLFWCENRRWTDGVIPYEIAGNVAPAERTAIASAMAHWEAMTPIRFVERNRNDPRHVHYLYFRAGDGCWSHVGRRGGRQEISMGSRCGFGAAVHEIGHAVGLFHEHTRCDRDQYIEILWDNIEEGQEHNFDVQCGSGIDHHLGYDYDSVMHYSPTGFGKMVNGSRLVTMRPREPGVTFGTSSFLSWQDIEMVRRMYGGVKTRAFTPSEQGFIAPNNWDPNTFPRVGDEDYSGGDVGGVVEYPILRSVLTFDLGELSQDTAIESAVLAVYQFGIRGDPFGDLGNIFVELVDLGASTSSADFDARALTYVGTLSTSRSVGTRELDVTQAVHRAQELGLLGRVQFRLRFQVDTDAMGDQDLVHIYRSDTTTIILPEPIGAHDPRLSITYK